MVKLGSGSEREIDDIMLSRYACYLIAQNGDPHKESIAFAQSYFSLQTRKQELSSTLYEHGIDDQGFARIRSKGDQALFGGKTTIQMKRKLAVPKSRTLADFLPTITIKAKDFASEITNFNVKKQNLFGESQIENEHMKNNRDVRHVLAKSQIYPEELPSAEDIKKLEKCIKKESKKFIEKPGVLPQILKK